MEENSFTVMVRDAFISSPGHSLVSADYSQIELRLAAHLAADKHLLNILLRAGVDGDTFRLIGARYLKKYPGAVTDEERQLAKRLCYGILYGQGNQALAATLKVGPDEVQNVIRAFMACFPDVRRFVEATKAKARSCGYIKTLYGRQRPLPDINSWDPEKRAQAERQAINTPIQGSAADIVKQAMIATKELESFQGGRTRLLMEIHDELVFEVPDVLVPSFGKRVQEVMQTAAGLDVPLPVNVRVGTRLGSLRPLTLP